MNPLWELISTRHQAPRLPRADLAVSQGANVPRLLVPRLLVRDQGRPPAALGICYLSHTLPRVLI
jgi:hypothetical protein